MASPDSHPSAFTPARLRDIHLRIAAAAAARGRDAKTVTLVGVTKGIELPKIQDAIEAGLRAVGENYVQEGVPKVKAIRAHSAAVEAHYIGRLQRNKVKEVVGAFEVIQSVDSLPLAQTISHQAGVLGVCPRIFLQVNIAEDPNKSGCRPEGVENLAENVLRLPHVRLSGVMTIGSFLSDGCSGARRSEFEAMASLHRNLERRFELSAFELSMGMSEDFELAIELGATVVRVGRALFGERPARAKTDEVRNQVENKGDTWRFLNHTD